ncbi:MAG TPA: T9SS type A sorting domain-containing protein, partial [Bacteroidales bacterium]|nr:T9SS type A sorting domain-containing protein [Bacteroidales bacterium]
NLVPPVPGVPVTHPLTFFHNGSAGYSDVGFAVTMMGIPVPLRYDNPELIYSFPLTTGSTWSSQSSVSIALPGLGAYYTSRQRSGVADGWGTLVTPYGTFQVIRVKSVLEEFDSIYIDSLGTGIPVHRSITQYQWLGKGQGVPLLEIDQEGPGATAYYRDHYHPLNGGMTVSIGPDTSVCPGSQLTLTAQVAGGFGPYHFIWSNFDTTKSITLTVDSSETIGVLAIDAVNDIAIGQVRITANCPGIEEKSWHSVEFFPNPSRGIIYALIPGSGTLQRFEISSLDGRKVLSGYPEPVSSQLFMIHAGGISPGEYLVRIWAGNKLYGGKIVLTTGNHP